MSKMHPMVCDYLPFKLISRRNDLRRANSNCQSCGLNSQLPKLMCVDGGAQEIHCNWSCYVISQDGLFLTLGMFLKLPRHVVYVVKCNFLYYHVDSRIREFSANIPIYMFTPNGECEMMTLDQLMPKSFGPENLPPPEELSK